MFLFLAFFWNTSKWQRPAGLGFVEIRYFSLPCFKPRLAKKTKISDNNDGDGNMFMNNHIKLRVKTKVQDKKSTKANLNR